MKPPLAITALGIFGALSMVTALGIWAFVPADGQPILSPRPDKGDAQICVIDAWLRSNAPDSPYLPEHGWYNGNGYRCPDQPETNP